MTLNLLVWSTAITHHWWSWSTMQSTFISTQLFNFLQPFHIASINHSLNHISLQILAKIFVSNIIIDLSYNVSKYIQSKVFQNCLKWVFYINTLFSLCIAWIGMESCLKFCILITAVYFKDRNQSLKPCIVLAVWWSVK